MMRFITKHASVKTVVTAFGFYCGLIASMGYIMEKLTGSNPVVEPFVWACTVTLFILASNLGVLACGYAQQLKQDEIDRLCVVKAELEAQVLRRRISSKGRKSA